jgi:hypothetical protein
METIDKMEEFMEKVATIFEDSFQQILRREYLEEICLYISFSALFIICHPEITTPSKTDKPPKKYQPLINKVLCAFLETGVYQLNSRQQELLLAENSLARKLYRIIMKSKKS